jgi:hypothetical protein
VTVVVVIDPARNALTPAERRAAEIMLSSPELVAFGTVADRLDGIEAAWRQYGALIEE